MKIFLDTSDVEAIKKGVDTGLVCGVTTNPSIILKSGKRFEDVVKEIIKVSPGHISVEAMAEDVPGLVSEAEKYSGMDSQIVVKVPMNETGLKAAKILESKGIRVNVTMVFTAVQASLGMLSGASFVSIVLSRLDAIGSDSHQLITDTMLIKKNYNFGTEIIAASLKTYNQVINCLGAGVDIISVPPALFEQIFRHPLTEAGLDGFKKDWMKVIN